MSSLHAADIVGHLAYIFLFVGMFGIVNKKTWGWIVRLAGEALWCWLGFVLGLTSIWFWCGLFFFMELYGWYKWRKTQ